MKRKAIIPECPKPFMITQKVKDNIEKWIQYFKKLSSRIIIKLPSDKDFDFDLYKSKTIEINEIPEGGQLLDYPEKKQITFLLVYDSSLPGQKSEFLIKNTYLFCYYGVAFGLNYFEWDGDGEDDQYCDNFSLRSYSERALSWEYIAGLLKNRLIEIESSVEKAP